MNLIKINLNQTVSKAEQDFISQEKKRWYTFYIICGLFLISFIWLISINSRLSYIVKERNNTIEIRLLVNHCVHRYVFAGIY